MSSFFKQQIGKLPFERYGTNYKNNGSAWIRCPNPQHSGGHESTPSMKVNIEGKYLGRFYCFGCKMKGSWNKLCEMIPSLTPIENENTIKNEQDFSFKRDVKEDIEVDITEFNKMIPWNKNKEWRGVQGQTLMDYEVKVYARKRSGNDEVYLRIPIKMGKRMVGYIDALGRQPRKFHNGSKEMSYINMDGIWAHSALIGYNQAKSKNYSKNEPLFIVEGPRDVFKTYENGCRVVGLIGSAVTPEKISHILGLNPSVIVVATDNDDAGNNAASLLKEGLKDLVPLVRLKFKDGNDPADVSRKFMRKVRKYALSKL